MQLYVLVTLTFHILVHFPTFYILFEQHYLMKGNKAEILLTACGH